MLFSEFKTKMLESGCSEVLERTWEPNAVAAAHSHPFAANALLVRGEMWLTVGEDTRHLRAGDTFKLDAGELHSERYGVVGATYWVGRT